MKKKIEDTKLMELLPKGFRQKLMGCPCIIDYYDKWDILSTEIDPNEICECNGNQAVVCLYKALEDSGLIRVWRNMDVDDRNIFRVKFKEKLSKAGVLKFKEVEK